MARDQLFFTAQLPEPVLLALIVQRTRAPQGSGALLEVKAFLVARDRLQSLFWEQVALDAWPGADLQTVLTAWQQQRRGPGLRLTFAVADPTLQLSVRQPSGGFALETMNLQDFSTIADPHGATRVRAGTGSLEVNGKRWQGPVLAEQLAAGSQAWPQFGQFEMWLAAAADGALWLGRTDLRAGTGQAVVLAPGQPPRVQRFTPQVTQTRPDAPSGFALPQAWRVTLEKPSDLQRRDGQPSRGTAPSGGPAVYDISVASGQGTTALVFHLQDQ